MIEFIIGKNDAGQRVDKFLLKATNNLPKSLLYKTFRKKDIKINGKWCQSSTFLFEGDQLKVFLSEEFFIVKPYEKVHVLPKIEIVYEDQNIIVVNKPVGLLSHSDQKGGDQDTAIDRIIQYLIEENFYNPETEKSFSPALVSRLDRNTGGLLTAAKNAEALRELSDMVREHRLTKKYLALVEGVPQKQGNLIGYLSKNETRNKVEIKETGKKVECKFCLLEVRENEKKERISLVEVELITGRSHQIRAQFANMGHPLIGDKKYGSKMKLKNGQRLFAYQLEFNPKVDSPLHYLEKKVMQKFPIWKDPLPSETIVWKANVHL